MKRLLFLAALVCAGCSSHTPLTILPSEREAALIQENESLRASLSALEKNCSAVLSLYKRARQYEKSAVSKEK
jgi:uncharacterized protein YcfL